jgi:Ribbon-helix-helix protein, copG family
MPLSFDDPKPHDKRKQQIIYLRPSLKSAIDEDRLRLGQNRSEWMERAFVEALKKRKGNAS